VLNHNLCTVHIVRTLIMNEPTGMSINPVCFGMLKRGIAKLEIESGTRHYNVYGGRYGNGTIRGIDIWVTDDVEGWKITMRGGDFVEVPTRHYENLN